MLMTTPDISIVLPVLNERENLQQLYEELTGVLTGLGREYELIFVDDGSTDGSTELCRELVSRDPRVVLIELRRRFGKATALQAGFGKARGDIIFSMDADLQDDPKEIPRFLEGFERGFDLVCGWKEDRKDSVSKTLPSRFFNFVTSRTSGLKLQDFNCGFKAYKREVIEGLDLYGELYRYIPVLVHTKGFKVGEIPVSHRPRRFGVSKYGAERFLRGPFDLFTILFLSTFRRRPLHLFGVIGVSIGFAGFLIDVYLAISWFTGTWIGNRPLLMMGTLMIIVGVQILIFGLLGEMIVSATYRATEVEGLIRRVRRHSDNESKARVAV
ncbi:MAG: glycosyltransferase family 2 protein [Steroidobacteraceae bacterium]